MNTVGKGQQGIFELIKTVPGIVVSVSSKPVTKTVNEIQGSDWELLDNCMRLIAIGLCLAKPLRSAT